MKKILLACTATYIAVLVLSNAGHAQKATRIVNYNMNEYNSDPSASATEKTNKGVDKMTISSKALHDFKKSFSGVTDEQWFVVKTGFNTKFTLDNIEYRVDYSKNGKWIGTMKQYDEKKLSHDVRSTVKRTYYDYSITWIKEISVPDYPNVTVFIIHIEDDKSFKNLQVVDGEMVVLEEYQKG